MALCAPRPVLFTNGREDTWINPAGQFEVLRAAAPVYRLLGAGDFAATELPPDGQLIDGTLGYFLRPGGHSLKPEDWKAFLDFADKQLGPPAKPRSASALADTGVRGRQPARQERRLHLWRCLAGRCTSLNCTGVAASRIPSATPPWWASSPHLRARPRPSEGFYDGDDTWRLRFAPDEEGEWRYRLRGEGVEIRQEGRLKCVAPRGHGFIRIHPQNPYAFAHADGTAFFPMGDTCYGLYDDSPITPALRREYLETRRRQRFNFVRMSVGHSEARAAADPAFWAWGGTPAKPDLDRLNPVFFRGLDELFRDLQARGMNVELLLLNFYRRPFTDTKLWTPARERLWLRYVVARYAAFDNLFLWTLANEYETHPDGRYRLDRPGDVDWAKATAQLVKQLDPYRHPVTVHPVISSSTRGASPRDPFDAPWRIGEFFGEGRRTGCALPADRAVRRGCRVGRQAPMLGGRCPGRGRQPARRPSFPQAGAQHGKRLRVSARPSHGEEAGASYRQSAAHLPGASSARAATSPLGFTARLATATSGTASTRRTATPSRSRTKAPRRQLGALYDFFTALPFWRMQPFDGVTGAAAVALAEPGKVYVVYLPQGGKVTVDLSAAQGPLTAQWFNPRDGRAGEPFSVPAGKPGRIPSRRIHKTGCCELRETPR